ncbi:flagellar hook-basal body complex protein FliE [Campylobacter sp. RM9344]|uniref:Flagellar hook-basal body complex protein FliE n=1 Tax=Campylobacter californiensis TaxID=1032243 RepID=A0AAW3ZT10_9BACT|nr:MULTISPECIES: flagellar hook-basal body complex protein FliE [unclassified Campylobacter]MBE2983957.1 flagellar hook-basal body complex protein FliE [Campylobacter sp. RM6883]MBE2986119.1 flagellar hook-basal body complex protein FliE [Campylobacter sp. RM12919]MBE2987532.1 flagellar hook-basal body complex protein FliE [Campylobacter sp. RM12920]MBE2994495.1 flagellar hook-basal body complex protein FliE [Campylobacter sp. RM6913]MBE3028803.1 flagellar hook-basal body complex protein FliE 
MINNINGINEASLAQNNKKVSQANQNEFENILNNSLKELNEVQVNADKAVADLATGEVKDLHQAAIAIGKADMSMKLMLEIRNKAISAYKEISRTQI